MRPNIELATPPSQSLVPPSLICADLVISGNLSCEGEVQIDGQVQGDVRARAVTVGVKGSVHGEIVAETVQVHGEVKGCIIANTIILAETAKMEGTIAQARLTVQFGAILDGPCRHIQALPAEQRNLNAGLAGFQKPASLSTMAAE